MRTFDPPNLPLPYAPYPVTASALRAVAAEAVIHGWALAHRVGRWASDAEVESGQIPEDEYWELSSIIESLKSLAGVRFAGANQAVVRIVEDLIVDAVITGAAAYEPQLERRVRREDAEVHLPYDPAWMAGSVASVMQNLADDLTQIGIRLPDLSSLSHAPVPFGEGAG